MEFSRQEYWSGLPFPTPEDLPDPGMDPKSLASPALAGGFFTAAPPRKRFTCTGFVTCTGALGEPVFLTQSQFPRRNSKN